MKKVIFGQDATTTMVNYHCRNAQEAKILRKVFIMHGIPVDYVADKNVVISGPQDVINKADNLMARF